MKESSHIGNYSHHETAKNCNYLFIANDERISRLIESWRPTLFIDKHDAPLKNNEEMRGILNVGLDVDGCVIRITGENHIPTKFNVFCAKVIVGTL